ncbi:MAG: hypothetical protein PHC84_03985, partial [Clostridia bacterium]|nr:hypothetical protein [Clostridia bacterium]
MRKRLLYTIVAIMAVVFSAVVIVLPIHYYKAKHSSYSGENWQLGYAREEITPTDYTQKQYFLSGNLSFVPDIMEQCADGMFVRAVCMSDGRGGLSALAVIDAKSVAHSHVAGIRSELAEFV